MNYIPRGVTVKCHHDTLNSNYSKISKNKIKIINGIHYRILQETIIKILCNWNSKHVNLIYILSKRRLKKFRKDGLDIRKAILLLRKTKINFQKLSEIDSNNIFTDNINSSIPQTYHPTTR